MALSAGTRLGPYEIVAPIGAGGMGEVYRARDTRLDRVVAVKVLPEHVACDPEWRQRFEREAKAISSLNHPHICTLHDVGSQDGTDFLVMEFLEGESLAQRLRSGALSLEQALRTAIQVVDALDKAHRQGIVHRDLKPGNIMLTKSGAKLLDFGLAKLRAVGAVGAAALSTAPTASAPLTRAGTIMGTFQYMAPEQVEGQEADSRADIFAFGAVLYEMVTGTKAFEGTSQVSIGAAILQREPPPLSSLRPSTPLALEHAVNQCLAKVAEERWQTAGDLMRELKWIATERTGTAVAIAEDARGGDRTAWVIATIMGVVALASLASVGVLHRRSAPETQPLVQFVVSPPEGWSTRTATGAPHIFAMSPDGRRLAFTAEGKDARTMLWVRTLDDAVAQPVKGTESADLPFWSPDGTFLGFVADGKFRKVSLTGGPPQTIADVGSIFPGSWNFDGTIVFTRNYKNALSRVSAAGGAVRPATQLEQGEVLHCLPNFLPDGQHLLYASFTGGAGRDINSDSVIYVGSLNSKERSELLRNVGPQVVYSQGRVFFARAGTLMAQGFDAARLKLVGEPSPIAEIGTGPFSISTNGALAYQTEGINATPSQLAWVDRTGRRISSVGSPGDYRWPALSPDGTRVAFHLHEVQGDRDLGEIWVMDIERGAPLRLTFQPPGDIPTWSPDGNNIAITHADGVYRKAANGAGPEELLSKSRAFVDSWAPDGSFLVVEQRYDKTGFDLMMLPLADDRALTPLVQSEFNERNGQLSPDGRWIAYQSDEGKSWQVFVQTVPPTGGRWQISTTGGGQPKWRNDGKELYYLTEDLKVMAVDIKTSGGALQPGTPHSLFQADIQSLGGLAGDRMYDVAADGSRFLIVTPYKTEASPITVVLNWAARSEK